MKKGLTLIEILVTALILVIGLTSLMMSFVYCLELSIRNSHRHNSTQIINQFFEELNRQESSLALNDFLNSPWSVYGNSSLNQGIVVRRKANFTVHSHEYFLTIREIDTVSPNPDTQLSVLEAVVTWSQNRENPNPRDVIGMRMLSNSPNL